MIYLPRVLSCPGISTRTCNGYVAGRGREYTAQHRALSEIPIWLGGSQHTYVEQQSSLQKYKPEIPSHIQAQKWITSALHMHSLYLPARQDQGQQRYLCVDLCCVRLAFPTEVAVLLSPPGGKTSSSLSLSCTAKAEIPSALSSPSSYWALATTKMTFVRVYLSYYLCLQLLTYLVKQWIYVLPSWCMKSKPDL